MTRLGTLAFCTLLVLTIGLLNCESIVSRSGIQCSSTAECRARGGDFATSRCSNEGLCEAIVAPEAGLAIGSACSSSEDCRTRLNEPSRCVASACLPLAPADMGCSLIGPVENDDALLLGALVPHGGAAAEEYRRAQDTLRWVVSEWNSRAQANERTKNIAIVECDESLLSKTLPHLLSLRPKSIVGPFTNAKFREYAAGDSVDIPMFAPTVDDTFLVDQPDSRRRLYSCIPNLNLAVKPFQRAAATLAERVATARGQDEAKVLLVKSSDESDQAFLAKFEDGLQLNGKAAAGQANYKVVSITTSILDNAAPPLLASAQTVALEKPDLVILSAGLVAEEFVTGVDNRWAGINPGAPRPVFLLMGRYSRLEESFAATKKEQSGRFFALDWMGNAKTAENYAAVMGDLLSRNALAGPSVARTVDCGLLATYAALAGASSASTSMLAVSTPQYLDGVKLATTGVDENTINLKSDTISTAVSLLGAVPPIKTKLSGAINPSIAFAANGTLTTGTSGLYCMSSNTASPAQTWTPTGMTFSEAGVENGSIACP